MADQSLMAMPASELAERIRDRSVSPVEAVDAALARIDKLNPRYNAYLTVCHDEARAGARAAEQKIANGDELGPLHGVPVSVKDLLYTKGIRSTGGSLVYQDFTPDTDAPLVARLRDAGAIILGKTNTPEFGIIPTTENRLGEPCRNPWDSERTTGGSSGGAAAAAALGLGSLHIGSDGGGSIRIPSSLCGVFGIKPTLGRVPPYTKEWGGYGGWPTLSQAGPITRSVDDAALLLDVIAGPEPGDPFAIPPAPGSFRPRAMGKLGLKIAWSPDLGWAAVDPEVRAICEQAARSFQDLGYQVEEADPGVAGEAMFAAFGPLAAGGDAAIHEDLLDAHESDLADYTERFLRAGLKVSAARYVRAEQLRTAIWQAFDEFLSRYDLLLTPTLATAGLPHRRATGVYRRRRSPWRRLDALHDDVQSHRPACGIGAVRLDIGRAAGRPPRDLSRLPREADLRSGPCVRGSASVDRPLACGRPAIQLVRPITQTPHAKQQLGQEQCVATSADAMSESMLSHHQELGIMLLLLELAVVRWLGARLSVERGQTLAEYGLIMSVISVAVVVAAIVLFRGAIDQSFHDTWHCLRLETQWCR